MMKKLLALLAAMSLMMLSGAVAEEGQLPGTTPAPVEMEEQEAAVLTEAEPAAEPQAAQSYVLEDVQPSLTEAYRWFVNQYRYARGVNVVYYDNVYAINHGKWGLTPFASDVPDEYFVVDTAGYYAVAPLVYDIVDAMRIRLYGGDVGELGLLYGQYCDRIASKYHQVGFSGVHEGIDFISKHGTPLYAILDGVVTRAGDRDGTVGVYNEEYDITLLYLHCEKIKVKRGQEIKAGTHIASEGKKGSGSSYAHVEMRYGRHTSSNKYRDTKLQSDCPYEMMQIALNVEPSEREAITYAAELEAERVLAEQKAAAEAAAAAAAAEAERMRLEAEAAAAAAAAEREAMEAAQKLAEATPEVQLVDVLPGTTPEGYGFDVATPAEVTPAAEATPVPEATLPPANP